MTPETDRPPRETHAIRWDTVTLDYIREAAAKWRDETKLPYTIADVIRLGAVNAAKRILSGDIPS